MKSTHGVAERTFEPQTFEIDDLLRVGKNRWVSGHHVRYHRRRSYRLDVIANQDVQTRNLTYLPVQDGIRLRGCNERRVLKQEPLDPRRNDDVAPIRRKVDLVHEDGQVDELLIHVRRGELRGLYRVIRTRGRGARVQTCDVGVGDLCQLVGRTVGGSVDQLGAHLRGVYVVNGEGEVLALVYNQRNPGVGQVLIGDSCAVLRVAAANGEVIEGMNMDPIAVGTDIALVVAVDHAGLGEDEVLLKLRQNASTPYARQHICYCQCSCPYGLAG